VVIRGARSRAYRLQVPDLGKHVRASVVATNAGGSRIVVTKPTIAVAPELVGPSNAAPPKILGVAHLGSTLEAAPGTWRGTQPIEITRSWLRCDAGECIRIRGARGPKYTIQAADVGSSIRIEERATSRAGRGLVRSAATSVAHESPQPQETTTAQPTAPAPTTPTYETVPPPVDP
jgi:hypothetical protein